MTDKKWGKTSAFLREHILTHGSDECLLWPFAMSSNGYCMMWHDGKVQTVHRVVCALEKGPAPTPAHQVAHSCGNRQCCNPRHLRWATRVENEADKVGHGTRIVGSAHVLSKLTETQVARLRSEKGSASIAELARRYGVSPSVADRIIKGKTWRHVAGAAA